MWKVFCGCESSRGRDTQKDPSPAPSRPCVKCKKPVHPRAKTCKHCGAAQPKAKRKAARKATKRSGSDVAQLARLAGEVEALEKKLDAKKRDLVKLAAKIAR